MADLPPPPPPPPAVRPAGFLARLSPVSFAVLSLGLIFFLYQVVAGLATFLLFKARVTEENVMLVRWATLGGQVLCILVPVLVLGRLRGGDVVRYFRFRLPEVRELLVTVVAVFALQQMLQGYMVLQDAIPLPPAAEKLVNEIRRMFEETYRLLVGARDPLEYLFVLVVVALVPALAEELLFRGLVQRSFEEVAGGARGAVIAGVIFGAYHLNPLSVVPLISLGVFFGFLVYRSQNVTLAVAAHFFNNFVACTAVYLHLSDDFVAVAPEGRASATVQMLNFMLFTLVFVSASWYFLQITDREHDD